MRRCQSKHEMIEMVWVTDRHRLSQVLELRSTNRGLSWVITYRDVAILFLCQMYRMHPIGVVEFAEYRVL